MNDNLNNKDEFDFRKEFENQKKELAHVQRVAQSYHSVDLPADGGNSYKRKTFKIKLIHIIILGIFVAAGIYFYNYYTVNKEHLYDGGANIQSLYDKKNLIRYVDNNLYGYINSEGQVIISARYKEAGNFYNNYALVDNSGKKEIINVKGLHIADASGEMDGYNIDYDYWIASGTLYSGSMIKIQDNVKKVDNHDKYFYYYNNELNQTNIIDYLGNNIYTFDGKNVKFDINSGSYTDELIYVVYNNKYLIINPVSKKVVYESSSAIESFEDGIYKQDRFYFIFDDETIYPYNAKNVTLVDRKNKILKIEESSESFYYFDTINNKQVDDYKLNDLEIVDSQFNYDLVFCDKENNLYSLMKDGNVLLECKYDKIEFLTDELQEYLRTKNGFEYVFAQNDKLNIVHNLRLKINSFEGENVKVDYVNGSPFVIYTPDNESDETQITVYNFLDNSKKKYPKVDYVYFDSGYNYYVLYNIRTEKLEYFNTGMKNIFTISYDIRENGLNGVYFDDQVYDENENNNQNNDVLNADN